MGGFVYDEATGKTLPFDPDEMTAWWEDNRTEPDELAQIQNLFDREEAEFQQAG